MIKGNEVKNMSVQGRSFCFARSLCGKEWFLNIRRAADMFLSLPMAVGGRNKVQADWLDMLDEVCKGCGTYTKRAGQTGKTACMYTVLSSVLCVGRLYCSSPCNFPVCTFLGSEGLRTLVHPTG